MSAWLVSLAFLRPAVCAVAGDGRLAVRGFVAWRGFPSSSLKSCGSGSRWTGFLVVRLLGGCLVGSGLVVCLVDGLIDWLVDSFSG